MIRRIGMIYEWWMDGEYVDEEGGVEDMKMEGEDVEEKKVEGNEEGVIRSGI